MSQQPRKKPATTPAQLALVGILSLVLIGVLASQWSGAEAPVSEAPRQPAAKPSAPAPKEETNKASRPQGPFGEFAADEPWAEATLEDAVKFDPLATPKWANPAPDVEAAAERKHGEEKLNELRNAQNTIIITAGDKKIARIGEHEFQVGDTVGGFRITEISSEGVVLSEVE
jgi:hypothetical protein